MSSMSPWGKGKDMFFFIFSDPNHKNLNKRLFIAPSNGTKDKNSPHFRQALLGGGKCK